MAEKEILFKSDNFLVAVHKDIYVGTEQHGMEHVHIYVQC